MVYTIYRIVNTVNNKTYIGFTGNYAKRVLAHRAMSGNRTKALYQAFRKYGIDNFVFEELYVTKDRGHALLEMEPYFISEHCSFGSRGYNMNAGGGNTNTAERIAAAQARMQANNPMKILRTNKGSFKPGQKPVITEERNAKISASKKGAKNPNFGKTGNADRLNVSVRCNVCGKTTNKGNLARWHQH